MPGVGGNAAGYYDKSLQSCIRVPYNTSDSESMHPDWVYDLSEVLPFPLDGCSIPDPSRMEASPFGNAGLIKNQKDECGPTSFSNMNSFMRDTFNSLNDSSAAERDDLEDKLRGVGGVCSPRKSTFGWHGKNLDKLCLEENPDGSGGSWHPSCGGRVVASSTSSSTRRSKDWKISESSLDMQWPSFGYNGEELSFGESNTLGEAGICNHGHSVQVDDGGSGMFIGMYEAPHTGDLTVCGTTKADIEGRGVTAEGNIPYSTLVREGGWGETNIEIWRTRPSTEGDDSSSPPSISEATGYKGYLSTGSEGARMEASSQAVSATDISIENKKGECIHGPDKDRNGIVCEPRDDKYNYDNQCFPQEVLSGLRAAK